MVVPQNGQRWGRLTTSLQCVIIMAILRANALNYLKQEHFLRLPSSFIFSASPPHSSYDVQNPKEAILVKFCYLPAFPRTKIESWLFLTEFVHVMNEKCPLWQIIEEKDGIIIDSWQSIRRMIAPRYVWWCERWVSLLIRTEFFITSPKVAPKRVCVE